MNFSRREFLKAGLAGSLAIGAGGLLDACGTGNTIKPFNNSAAGKPQTGGQLRAGLTGGSTADTLSPLNPITNVDFSRINNLYEPLVGLTPEAQPVYVCWPRNSRPTPTPPSGRSGSGRASPSTTASR